MGGFTYETRKKLTEQRILEAKEAGKDLTGMEKKLLPSVLLCKDRASPVDDQGSGKRGGRDIKRDL